MATGGNLPVSELDFFTIKDSLKEYLSNQSVFKDYDFEGSALSNLLDVLAYNTHYMGFYANMVANEMFLDSAVTRNAVVSRAKELGHTPSSSKAAQAQVHISYPNATSYPSIIPAGSIFPATNELDESFTFVNTETITLGATGGSGGNVPGATATIHEGQYRSVSFVFDGNSTSQKFIIPSTTVDTSHLTIRIQNSITDGTGFYSPWDLSSNYAGLTSGSETYFLQEIEDGRYEIYFGDGIVGKKPSHGNVITVNYLDTKGSLANNVGKYDVRNQRRSISYTSSTVDVISHAQGGGNPEGIDSIKYYAPRSYQAQDRAVTVEDYKTLVATQYGDAETVYVYGGEDAIPQQYGKVFISIKPKSGTSLSDFEKQSIKTSILEGKNIVSILPEIVDPEYIYVMVDSKITYDPARTTLTGETFKSLIKTQILNYVDNKLEKFGKNMFYSKLLHIIDRYDDSISGNETKLKMQKRLQPRIGTAGGYTINFYNPIYHPHDGHMEGVVKSSTFKYKDNDGITVNAYILDDGRGKLILYTTKESTKYKIKEIGSVDYGNGSLDLVSFDPVQDDSSVTIKFTVEPQNVDIYSSRNNLITIDSLDPDAIKINMEILGRQSLVGTTTPTSHGGHTSTTSTTSTSTSSSSSSSTGSQSSGY